MQSLYLLGSHSLSWGKNIKELWCTAELRSGNHHRGLARSGKVSCTRDTLMEVWGLARLHSE